MPGASGYHLLRRIELGGESSWGYLAFDSLARRLFISRQDKVIVIDVDSGKVEGEITDTPGVQGIALAPELGRGFTSNGEKNNVTIFDLSSLKTLGTADAGEGPGAIVYDPGSKRVFVMNDVGHSATAIDGASGKVLASIALRGRPEYAVPDGAGHLYVNLADKNEQQLINTQDLTATSFWSILPCEAPLGLGMDILHRRLFLGCT
ncbi:MAG: YncE family protein, partial [Candidatus Acidiferrales bacterium]